MQIMNIYQQNRMRQLAAKFFGSHPFISVTPELSQDPEFGELETLFRMKKDCLDYYLTKSTPIDPMRALVRADAADIYASWLNHDADPLYTKEWYEALKAIEGKWVYLETEYLYPTHVETVAIPNVSLNGLRLDTKYIEAIDLMNWTYEAIEKSIKDFYGREMPGHRVEMGEWDRMVGAALRLRRKLAHRQ
jgi:hypothetical protein